MRPKPAPSSRRLAKDSNNTTVRDEGTLRREKPLKKAARHFLCEIIDSFITMWLHSDQVHEEPDP
jgi:hypothetical protein